MFVYRVLFFLVVIIPLSRCEIVTSNEMLTWEEAMGYCTNISARPVASDMASHEQLNSSLLVWTSDRIFIGSNCVKSRLCAFMYHSNTLTNRTGYLFYMDCNTKLPCRETGNNELTHNAYTYEEATENCFSSSMNDEHRVHEVVEYYWIKRTLYYCSLQTKDEHVDDRRGTFCGVYNMKFGLAFGHCSKSNYAICQSDSNSDFSSQNDFSMVIGVSIGVCIIFVSGVMIAIVYTRRRRQSKSKQQEPICKFTKEKDSSKNRLKTCVNAAYEVQASENDDRVEFSQQICHKANRSNSCHPELELTPQENYGYEHEHDDTELIFVENEHGDTTNDVNKNTEIYSEIDIENNVDTQANDRFEESKQHMYNSLIKDNAQYETQRATHRNDLSDNVNNNAEIYSEINIEIKADNHAFEAIEESKQHTCIYNGLTKDNVQYETLNATHRDEFVSNNVYNHVACDNKVESDYDLTRPSKFRDLNETDHVYNTFTGESDDYGDTESLTKSKRSELEDSTYNTLSLK